MHTAPVVDHVNYKYSADVDADVRTEVDVKATDVVDQMDRFPLTTAVSMSQSSLRTMTSNLLTCLLKVCSIYLTTQGSPRIWSLIWFTHYLLTTFTKPYPTEYRYSV